MMRFLATKPAYPFSSQLPFPCPDVSVFGLRKNAEGRNRTGDTMIFSHVLYRLSYLGTSRYSSRAVGP